MEKNTTLLKRKVHSSKSQESDEEKAIKLQELDEKKATKNKKSEVKGIERTIRWMAAKGDGLDEEEREVIRKSLSRWGRSNKEFVQNSSFNYFIETLLECLALEECFLPF